MAKTKRNRYLIALDGCDDYTEIEWLLSDKEARLLQAIADQSLKLKVSNYRCMPTMSVEPIREDVDDE